MNESFLAKHFKSKKINRTTSGSKSTLHIREQIEGFKVPDKSTVDNLFDGYTDGTCQSNRTIIGRICWILSNNRN